MRSNLLVPALLLTAGSTALCADAPKLLQSFEIEADIQGAKLNHAQAALVDQGATDGKKALSVTFNPPASYPGYSFPITEPLDWSAGGGIALDVTNPGTEAFSFVLRIDSTAGSDGSSNSRSASAKIPAGKTVTVMMPFNADPVSPDMSKLPGYTFMDPGGWKPFNPGTIRNVMFFIVKPPASRTLVFDNLRLVPKLPPVEVVYRTDTKQVMSFEGKDIAEPKSNSSSFAPTTQGVTEGKGALRLKFDPPATYPSVNFPFPSPQDFAGYGGLAMDLSNPGKESISFGVRLDSVATKGEGVSQGMASLEAGEKASFLLPFGVSASSLGMKSLPGMGGYRNIGAGGWGSFDPGKTTAWQIFMVRPSSSQELIVDNVRVVPGQKQDFNKIIDKYGQYTRADWPGKIKADADFAAQIAKEDAEFKNLSPLPDQNKYGGWAKGPQLKATGFFRTEKYNGKWAFVDPEGRLFLSFGPTTLTNGAPTNLSGREYMFTTLPKDDPILAKYKTETGGERLDFLSANLERKYGADFKKLWYARTYDRLRNWGFTSIGAFSSWDTLNNGKIPYTATVWIPGTHSKVQTTPGHTFDDPFDPKFAVDVVTATRGQFRMIKDDPFCIGYFLGNEEAWGHYKSGTKSYFAIIFGAMKMKAEQSPAKRAFLAQLQEKYGEVSKLNAAWGTNFADWSAMTEPLTLKDSLTEANQADFSALLRSFADQYFKTVQASIKSVDPNHLYLGIRFAGHSPEIVAANAQYGDVVSFNIYRQTIDPIEFNIIDTIDKPVLIGEFHFGAADRGMFDGGLVPVADQAARARGYKNYINSVLDHPKLVGAHWFQYTDQPTTARAMDTENGNTGLVSITDTPFPELTQAARETHAQMYTRRFGKP